MRLQILDPSIRFSCNGCTACCRQPYRVVIDATRAAAALRHDFSAYPELAGRALFEPSRDGKPDQFEIPKHPDGRCLMLTPQGLCILHKELGSDAKPSMCAQFPFIPARTWTDDRISANFACPTIQADKGVPLNQQAEEIARNVVKTARPTNPEALIPLDQNHKLTNNEFDALMDRAAAYFVDPSMPSLWHRFARVLSLLAVARNHLGRPNRPRTTSAASPPNPPGNELIELLRTDAPFSESAEIPDLNPFDSPAHAPMPARFLFAANLYPDTLPPDASPKMGLARRLTILPRLMSLARMSGAYASRLLGRNLSIVSIMNHPISPDLDPESDLLLRRYFHSRLWQRLPAGTRLPIIAGIHQHILDLGAILFFARADALHDRADRLTPAHIRDNLQRVEFHIANQSRLHQQTLRGWLLRHLSNLDTALHGLRLAALPADTPARFSLAARAAAR